MKHPILDNDKNPWRETWRCAAYGHRPMNGRCSRCGLLLHRSSAALDGEDNHE